MLKKLYQKNELYFALVWIGLYVISMNIALRFCNGFDHLETKTPAQLLVPVGCILLLAAAATVWICRNKLCKTFGLCRFQGDIKDFLCFSPLILISCINLKNGLGFGAPATVSLLMMVNLATAGYLEELIFRGFLFRAMEKDHLTTAVIVSAVTFGAGHIVNLVNTTDTLGVLLQVCYAISIGFLYTVIVCRSGCLWPCISSHMFVNGTSVLAREQGPFTELVALLFGQATPELVEICSAALIILISGTSAWWLWKKR